MDMVYYEQPVLLLFPILLLLWQVFGFLLKKKVQLSPLADIALAGVGVVGHAVAISVVFLSGGTLSDTLLLVLLSGTLSLALSPKPNTADDQTKGENR